MKMIDCHCDTLMALNDARLAGTEKTFERNDLHVDLEKLEKGITCSCVLRHSSIMQRAPYRHYWK